jgi:Flp pilus assembly protein TadB
VRTVNPSLILLILVWVALLLPGALRSGVRSSPRATVGGFQRAMDGLRTDRTVDVAPLHRGAARAGQTASRSARGVPNAGVRSEQPVIARRRTRFLRLSAATAVALIAAPVLGGVVWVIAALFVGALGVAVVVLRRLKVQREAARSVLTRLDLRRPAQPLVDEITGELVVAAGSGGGVVRLRRFDR